MAEQIRIQTPFTEEMSRKLKAGDAVLISGEIIAARDAAHKANKLSIVFEESDGLLPWPDAGKTG